MTHRALCERALLFLAVLSCLHSRMSGQVTFSKDWTIGKRSPPDPQCNPAVKSADEICKLFVNEVRQIVACETKSHLRMQKEYDENQGEMYFEERDGR
ncbi:uncharacterized protein LOC117282493 [Cryptotermes secundus]|uniref:uncharacterized protein LOC117282493 n=1 Tax=Cryptotermes secundus TaxID=105785 RepID=UPI001454C3AB|nr:uncharacterized protein LOC117282493 [Cryptotermes secundus]